MSQQTLHPMLNIAVKAARAAGSIINRAALDVERLTITAKGVNDFVTEGEPPIGILYIDDQAEQTQLARLETLRRTRDQAAVDRALDGLRRVAAGSAGNTMEPLLAAVRAYATVGEMCGALRQVWGEYVEQPII